MVNYKEARVLEIENVEHPIHILGVQAQAFIGCFWAFLITLIIHPLFAPFSAIIVGFISRLFFEREQSGRPLIFGRQFLGLSRRFPFIQNIISGIDGIIISKGVYNGD